VLSPDVEIDGVVVEAAGRWAASTGYPIEVRPGGVPVRLVDRLPVGDGTESRGATTADLRLVQIHVRAPDKPRTVLHELGHVLGGLHVDTMGVLSFHKGYEAVIDSASLTSVCARLPCLTFNPEAE
jgi:hypothetical protein